MMEQTKKRRSSILKTRKPQNSNKEITRRISFSGVKSIKEFCPGEEQATIWGTSYEEADANPSTGDIAPVVRHDKNSKSSFILKSSDTVCNKKAAEELSWAHIIQDKENIFCLDETQSESTDLISLMSIGKTQSISSKYLDSYKRCLRQSKEMLCRSFDFSHQSDKTVSIENTVDVTLASYELELYKFSKGLPDSNFICSTATLLSTNEQCNADITVPITHQELAYLNEKINKNLEAYTLSSDIKSDNFIELPQKLVKSDSESNSISTQKLSNSRYSFKAEDLSENMNISINTCQMTYSAIDLSQTDKENIPPSVCYCFDDVATKRSNIFNQFRSTDSNKKRNSQDFSPNTVPNQYFDQTFQKELSFDVANDLRQKTFVENKTLDTSQKNEHSIFKSLSISNYQQNIPLTIESDANETQLFSNGRLSESNTCNVSFLPETYCLHDKQINRENILQQNKQEKEPELKTPTREFAWFVEDTPHREFLKEEAAVLESVEESSPHVALRKMPRCSQNLRQTLFNKSDIEISSFENFLVSKIQENQLSSSQDKQQFQQNSILLEESGLIPLDYTSVYHKNKTYKSNKHNRGLHNQNYLQKFYVENHILQENTPVQAEKENVYCNRKERKTLHEPQDMSFEEISMSVCQQVSQNKKNERRNSLRFAYEEKNQKGDAENQRGLVEMNDPTMDLTLTEGNEQYSLAKNIFLNYDTQYVEVEKSETWNSDMCEISEIIFNPKTFSAEQPEDCEKAGKDEFFMKPNKFFDGEPQETSEKLVTISENRLRDDVLILIASATMDTNEEKITEKLQHENRRRETIHEQENIELDYSLCNPLKDTKLDYNDRSSFSSEPQKKGRSKRDTTFELTQIESEEILSSMQSKSTLGKLPACDTNLPSKSKDMNFEDNNVNVKRDISLKFDRPDERRSKSVIGKQVLQNTLNIEGFARSISMERLQDAEDCALTHSFNTIDIARRATTFRKDSVCEHILPNSKTNENSKIRDEKKSVNIEDEFNSDSMFFEQFENLLESEKIPTMIDSVENCVFKKFEQGDPKTHSITEDGATYIEYEEDIDKMQLSLVGTLDDDSLKELIIHSGLPQEKVLEIHYSSLSANVENAIDSFFSDPVPPPVLNISVLTNLSNKPHINDVIHYWQKRWRQSDSFFVSNKVDVLISNFTTRKIQDNDDFLFELQKIEDEWNLKLQMEHNTRCSKIQITNQQFLNNYLLQFKSKTSNWIMDENLNAVNILKFSHRRLKTFAIVVIFSTDFLDSIGTWSDIDKINLCVPKQNWEPIEYAVHFQLLIELPYNLKSLCPSIESLKNALVHIDSVVMKIVKLGIDMWNIILKSTSSLVRDPSGTIYIKKTVRETIRHKAITAKNEVIITQHEFLIQVSNINKISYKDIEFPPFYKLDESVQLLPIGLEFLKVFLRDPLIYLKKT